MKQAPSERRPLSYDDAPVRVGIAACLLGQEVRWDGGHKRELFLSEVLARYVEWVPVCPEVEIGMGVPREAVNLVLRGREIRMVGTESGEDWTARMKAWADGRARELAKLDVCGYVLKKDSPSCGLERVSVRRKKGMPRREGRGLFAQALVRHHPTLPVEEEGRLRDAARRENFIERLFAYRRLRSLFAGRWTVEHLVAFHAAHELQLMAHSPQIYRSLGRLVASARRTGRAELRERYEHQFTSALALRAARRRHVSVLKHCLGRFGNQLEREARAELLSLIDGYRTELVPLIVPITMMRHYVRRLGPEYLSGQSYLEPDPRELMLRNHV